MSIRAVFSTVLLVVLATHAAGQSAEYYKLVQKGEALYNAKQYKESAQAYSKAFATFGGMALPEDRYNVACVWALAGNKNLALYHLQYLANKGHFQNYKHLLDDSDLISLHTDKRWEPICQQVKRNKNWAEARLNKPLVARLDTILNNDQKYRGMLDSVSGKYGQDSKEVGALWKTIAFYDSLDEIAVVAILEKYGWPRIDMVGDDGSETIFLVIQHSPLKVQDKYLPVMRAAVKKGDAKASALALLEDRVALRHAGKQIYGSQVSGDAKGMYLSPMTDPDNVDERRASVGLGPLAGYLQNWGMTWDPADYKKQLPEIEKRAAANH